LELAQDNIFLANFACFICRSENVDQISSSLTVCASIATSDASP